MGKLRSCWSGVNGVLSVVVELIGQAGENRARAGIEGTISQAVTLTGIRKARYTGIGKVHLEHIFAAIAVNLTRLDASWTGIVLQRTRTTHLARFDLALAA